ncbi:MAG: hypothetical protein O3C01_05095 [Bacteroidetes bacterium]|nr:hypothetical protein [Bacteroidota bacterium]
MDKIKLFIVMLICVNTNLYSQDLPIISSKVDTTSIKVGEQIKYELKLTVDTLTLVALDSNKFFTPFEVILEEEWDTLRFENKFSLKKNFSLTSFDPGTFFLKSPKIIINDVLFYSDSILIDVLSVKVDTVSKKFFDIKNIIEVNKNDEGWWRNYVVIGIIILVVILIWKLYKRIFNSKLENEKTQPPFERAINALQLLESSNLKEQFEYKLYYSKLTEIVKNFLEEEVNLDALESTTDELISKLELLKHSGKLSLSNETIINFKAVLRTADLVKFAKSNPGNEIAFSDKKVLEKVLIDTKEAIPAPTELELLKNKEYLEKINKQKKNKIIKLFFGIISGLVLLSLILSIMIFGWQDVKDNVIGNSTKKLLKQDWTISTYGAFPVTISSPDALIRVLETENQKFEWGSLSSKINIILNIKPSDKEKMTDPQQLIDDLIFSLKKIGAENILTMQEEFYLDNGLSAIKFLGSFDYSTNNGTQIKKEYSSITFNHKGGTQNVQIIFDRNNDYAKQISNKVEESIKFEN